MQLSKLNPDWEAARLHGLSTIPGIAKAHQKKNGIFCPCCLNRVDKEKAPLCENSKELQFLGFGFPLFYIFLKYCIILLIVSIASYNAIVLYWAVTNSDVLCKATPNGCSSFMVSFSQISGVVSNAEIVVRIFSFIIQLSMLLYIRDLITKTSSYYDERSCSLSNYSIIVKNLPEAKGTRRNLINFLENYFEKPYKIYQITLLPQYEDFYQMEQQRNQVIQKMKPLMANEELNQDKLEELSEEIDRMENELIQYCNKEIDLEDNDECPTEKLIFSCWTEDSKFQILHGFEDISEEKKREAFHIAPDEECNIEFGVAPEPKEINWQHINYPDHKRVGRMIIGWIATTIFLIGITVIFFFVLSEKSALMVQSFSQSDQGSYYIGLFLVYLALICVIIFNKFVMGAVLHKIIDFQRHPTTDEEQFHFALKYSVGMFFTTALMTLAVEDLRYNNFYDRPYGVIEEETIMFIMNGLFVPFIWMVNPWQIGVILKRKANEGRKDITQKEANKIMESVQYNMGKRYAEIVECMWFTFLYSSLIPIGAFLSLIGLGLYYWVDKYNLLRRSSVNSKIVGELSHFSMKLLDFTLLCKPIGEILFDAQIRDSYCISSIVMSAVAILYLVLPIDDFLTYFHSEKFKTEQKTFEQAQKIIKDTYQTLHPIFSLKKENQQKMYESFRRSEPNNALDEEMSESIKPVNSKKLVTDESSSMRLTHLKDATTVLRALFQKHDAFTIKMKEKPKQHGKELKVKWSLQDCQ